VDEAKRPARPDPVRSIHEEVAVSATDAMLARLQAELEERRTFMDGLVEAAQSAGRDMSP